MIKTSKESQNTNPTADTLTEENVPDYIRAGFKTRLEFLEWLAPKTRTENNNEEYRKWGFESRAHVLDALMEEEIGPIEEDDSMLGHTERAGFCYNFDTVSSSRPVDETIISRGIP